MSDFEIIAWTVFVLFVLTLLNPAYGVVIVGMIIFTAVVRLLSALFNKHYEATSYVKVTTPRRRVQRTVRVLGFPLVFRFKI